MGQVNTMNTMWRDKTQDFLSDERKIYLLHYMFIIIFVSIIQPFYEMDLTPIGQT